jgi:hypothetical protein
MRYDLNDAKAVAALNKIDDFTSIEKASNFFDYLKTGRLPPVTKGDVLFFFSPAAIFARVKVTIPACNLIAVSKGVAIPLEIEFPPRDKRVTIPDSFVPVATIVPSKLRIGTTKKHSYLAILNGDEDYNPLVDTESAVNIDFPTISFQCLGRFYQKRRELSDEVSNEILMQVGKWLVDGTIELVDYTPDQKKEATTTQKQQMKAWQKSPSKYSPPIPPESGFSWVRGNWLCYRLVSGSSIQQQHPYRSRRRNLFWMRNRRQM